jgi:hypothetical protein
MPSVSAAGKTLSFRPKYNSYFYENIPCQAAVLNEYGSIQFTVKGPAEGNMTLEMQARASCSASTYKSSWFLVEDLTGATQTITVPLSSFPELNYNAITGLVWSTWSNSSTVWEVSQIQFGCATSASPAVSSGMISGSMSMAYRNADFQASLIYQQRTHHPFQHFLAGLPALLPLNTVWIMVSLRRPLALNVPIASLMIGNLNPASPFFSTILCFSPALMMEQWNQ